MAVLVNKNKRSLTGCHSLSDVIKLYFRGACRSDVAKKNFFEKIDEDKKLKAKLDDVGFSKDIKFVTPKILAIFVEYWGHPDECLCIENRNN